MTVENTKDVKVPETELNKLHLCISALAEMHLHLIRLLEQKEALKDNEKAYPIISEYVEQICRDDQKKVQAMLDQIIDGNRNITESNISRSYEDVMKDLDPEQMIVLSRDDLLDLEADMIDQADTIDALVDVFNKMINGQKICFVDLFALLEEASNLSDYIYEKWDHAQLVEEAKQ